MSAPEYADILASARSNWGRWGGDDEVGALNFLGNEQVLSAVSEVRSGRVFTLGCRIGDPDGDPIWPGEGRSPAQRYNARDYGAYEDGRVSAFAGGLKFADDVLILFSHGTTHTDALGHAWYGDQIYNGYDAKSTVGWMRRASVCPIGERGVVGRAVLVDMARYLGKPHLDMGEEFSLDQLLAAANQQGSAIRPRDILVVRTGWVKAFREDRASMMSARPYNEPGLEFGSHVIDWFWRMEIPALATDTLGNELTLQPDTGVHGAFHAGLMRNLGVTFHEILDLEALANDCCDDGQYTFLFAAAPLKVVGGTGGPVNPIAIK